MKEKRPRYSEEFKREAVRVVRTSGQSLGEVATDLGVSERHLRRWAKGEFIDPSPQLAISAAERAELKQLRKRVKVLQHEQEILRKAADFFARETR